MLFLLGLRIAAVATRFLTSQRWPEDSVVSPASRLDAVGLVVLGQLGAGQRGSDIGVNTAPNHVVVRLRPLQGIHTEPSASEIC